MSHNLLAGLMLVALAAVCSAQDIPNNNASVAEVQAELAAAQSRIAALQQELGQLQSVMGSLHDHLAKLPPVDTAEVDITSSFASHRQASDAEIADTPGDVGQEVAYEVCGECCDCCCPSWSARAGYVHLWRERTGSDFVVFEDNGDNPLRTADELDLGNASGIDATLVWDDGCGQGWAIRYLGMEEFAFSETVNFGVNLRPATNPNSSTALVAGNDLAIRHQSAIDSIEIVRTCGTDCTGFTFGFRYLELDESLRVNPVAAPTTFFQFAAKNRLYGVQAAVNQRVWDNGCGLSVHRLAKAGLYYNDVDASSVVLTGTLVDSGQASDQRAAFVGELGLNADYCLGRCWALTAGYQLLFIDGVALAADQVPNTGNLTVGTGANTTPVAVCCITG